MIIYYNYGSIDPQNLAKIGLLDVEITVLKGNVKNKKRQQNL